MAAVCAVFLFGSAIEEGGGGRAGEGDRAGRARVVHTAFTLAGNRIGEAMISGNRVAQFQEIFGLFQKHFPGKRNKLHERKLFDMLREQLLKTCRKRFHHI